MRLLLFTLVISCANSFKLPFKMGGFRNASAVSTSSTSPKPSFLGMFSFTPQITVSKFPPIFELIVQRIQAQFSNYVHEDLSRPQTYDKPVYTLAPDEIALFSDEIPVALKPPIMVMIESFELINSDDYNSTMEIEYEIKNANKLLQGVDGDSYSYNTTILEGVRGLLRQKNRAEEIIGIIGFNETTNYNIFGEDTASFASRFNETMKKNVSAILENERTPRKSQILIAVTKIDSKIIANVIEVLKGENREKYFSLFDNQNINEDNKKKQEVVITGENQEHINEQIIAEINQVHDNNEMNKDNQLNFNGAGLEVIHQVNTESNLVIVADNNPLIITEDTGNQENNSSEEIKISSDDLKVISINKIVETHEYDQIPQLGNKGYGKTDFEQEFSDGDKKQHTNTDYEQDFNQQQKVAGVMEDSEGYEHVQIMDDEQANLNDVVLDGSPEDDQSFGTNYALEYAEKLPTDDENFVITNYERNSFKPLRRIFNYREERDVKPPKKKHHGFRPKPDSIIVGPIVVKEENLDGADTAPKEVGIPHVHLPTITGYLDGEDETFYKKEDVEYEFSTKRTTSWPLDEIGRK